MLKAESGAEGPDEERDISLSGDWRKPRMSLIIRQVDFK